MMRTRSIFPSALLVLAGCAGPVAAEGGAAPSTDSSPSILESPAATVVSGGVHLAQPPALPGLVPLGAENPFDDRLPGRPAATDHPTPDWPFDIRHYDIWVSLDFPGRSIEGTVAISVRARRDGLTEFPLHAVDLHISDVERGDGRPVTFDHDGSVLTVRSDTPFPTDRDLVLTVRYSGRPQRGLYFNLPGPDDPDGPRQAFTQGECEDNRHWLPCHDFPDDRATHELHATVPHGMVVVGAGQRLPVTDTPDGRQTWHFRMDQPHVAYLITMVAGDYVLIEDESVVPLEFVVEPRDAPHAAHSLRHTDSILRFFGDYTGRPYPYSRYAQTTVRDFMFGGMENVTATTLTDRTIHPPDHEPQARSTGLVAHEAAHQWFGDLLTCAEWPHVWLNEGFATYFTALYNEHAFGRDEFLLSLRGSRRSGLGAFDGKRRAVVTNRYAGPFDVFGGHAYGGSAARLHMLRSLLGDDAFRETVRTYVKRHENQLVRTDDFRAAAEEASGQDLKWWFDQWFFGPGYPKLKVRWKWDDEARSMHVTVEQTHRVAGGVPKAFRLPLDIAFDSANGETTTTRLDLTERKHEFDIPLAARPWLVRVDPETVLLARYDLGRRLEEWTELVMVDPNPARRIEAAQALGKITKNAKLEKKDRDTAEGALVMALLQEPLAQVRSVLARQVATRRTEKTAAILAGLVDADPDLRVRVAAAGALGQYDGNGRAASALRKALDEGPDPLRAAAVRSLAKIKADDAYDRILTELARPGWQSRVRAAALEALADLGDERAFPILVRYAAADADRMSRRSAISALGRMGNGRPEYRDALLPHLEDPQRDVRSSVAGALGRIADPDTIPILCAAFHREPWDRTERAFHRAVKACRKKAVNDDRLVTVEAVRAASLREEHAARSKELAALPKPPKKGDKAKRDPAVQKRRRELRKEMTRLKKELDGLGVGLPPKKRKPVPAKAKAAPAPAGTAR